MTNNDNSNFFDDFSSSTDDKYDCSVNIERFEDEKKNDSRYLEISLDMTAFPKYEKIETNTWLSFYFSKIRTEFLSAKQTVTLHVFYTLFLCIKLSA